MRAFLLNVFALDVQHMTPADWLGLVVTLITFAALAIAYYKTFHPKNRLSLESHRYHLMDHDRDVPNWGKERRETRIRER
jgi:hypothetical protein